MQGDVSKAVDVKALFDAAEAAFGTADILVNNAGVYGMSPLGTIDEASYRRYFDLNVLGVMPATQEAAGRFIGKPGVIINISSGASLTPGPGMSIYSATKAAVDNLTRSFALELGTKARVVSLSPGLTITEGLQRLSEGGDDSFATFVLSRTPLARFGQPEDIAKVAAFLASDDAGWMSGEVVQVGGGLRF